MWQLCRTWERICNLVIWFPVIWRDQDWDYSQLFLILSHKLGRMEALHRRNRRFVGVEHTIRQLATARILAHRIATEDYAAAEWEQYWIKYPPLSLSNMGGWRSPNKKQAAEMMNLFERENNLQKQDVGLLCKLLSRNYKSWWD